MALWPGSDIAPVDIGGKVGFTGANDEHLVQVYSQTKHHSDQYAYFGLVDGKNKELKIFRHSDLNNISVFQVIKLSKVQNFD